MWDSGGRKWGCRGTSVGGWALIDCVDNFVVVSEKSGRVSTGRRGTGEEEDGLWVKPAGNRNSAEIRRPMIRSTGHSHILSFILLGMLLSALHRQAL